MDRRTFLSALSLAPVAANEALRMVADPSTNPKPSSSESASMWTYLWDIADEGYQTVMERLKENGLTSLSLATAYHAGKFLAPHNPKRKVVFLEDGTVYFQPNRGSYGRVKPLVNSLVKDGHHLASVKKAADKFGLQTRAWVVCCHNTRLGMQYPEIACENAFGDKIYHNLCPSSRELREYLRSIVNDIAAHGIDTIELEALQFQGYGHGFHHEREGIELSTAMRFLLGLCFCPSCLSRGRDSGMSLESIRSFTRSTLQQHFERPGSMDDKYGNVDSLPKEVFEPFLGWRKSVVVSLVEELSGFAKSTKLRPMMSLDPAARALVSMDAAKVSEATGGVLALGYLKDGAALRAPLAGLQSIVGSAEVTVGFQVGLPESGGRKEFLDRMSVAKDLGIRSFNFYNYGFIPLENLSWIREVLRG